MNTDTFRSKLMALLQKSRKAVRLYTVLAKDKHIASQDIDISSLQVEPWRVVNIDLSRSLALLLSDNYKQGLADGVCKLRDRFYEEWRNSEGSLHKNHKQLLLSVERSDFVKAINLSRDLVELKTKVQALQAAHHELNEIVERFNIKSSDNSLAKTADQNFEFSQVVDLPIEQVVNPIVRNAKVIPLRKRT